MAQENSRRRTDEALARLSAAKVSDDIDYELIGRVVVGELLGRSNERSQGGLIQGAVQFALRRNPSDAAEREAEICCVCWRGHGDLWECYGKCCDIPEDEFGK